MSTHLPAYTQKTIKDQLLTNGASGTIYAFAFPETRKVVEDILDGGDRTEMVQQAVQAAVKNFNTASGHGLSDLIAQTVNQALQTGRKEYTDIFEGAWTGRQDDVDVQFFNAWKKWASPIVTLSDELTAYAYPTAGASEGLRECINQYSCRARTENFQPTVHVFQGEYEGFTAYAKAAGIPVVAHDRNDWQSAIAQIGPHDQFYLSQPSAIDGNVWDEFDAFAESLYDQQPQAQLMLDLTYVGSVAREFSVRADHPNIPAVFFSLSKPFGAYYHRIGGLLSRTPIESMVGNKWFKGLQALRVGTALLERSTPYDLPRKYEPYRHQALETVSRNLGIDLKASDVLLFATADSSQADSDVKRALLRGATSQQFMRVCVTPQIAKIVPGGVYIDNDNNRIQPPSAIHGTALKDMTP